MKLPLRVHLGTAFTLIVLLVGGLIGWLAHDRTTEILADSSRQLTDAIGARLQADFAHRKARAQSLLNVLAQHPGIDEGSLAGRLANVPALAAALRAMPTVVAIYAGFGDGDFFLLRRLLKDTDYEVFDAPADAHFVVQSIERDDDAAESRYVYLDDAYREIARKPRPQAVSYDPRTRPWYRDAQAVDGLVETAPYRFFTSGLMGTSMAMRLVPGTTTLAIDLRLDDFAATLRDVRPTPGARLALFDADGHVLAIDDPTYRYTADAAVPAEFRGLFDGAERPEGDIDARSLSVDGEPWQGSLLNVLGDETRPIYLALTVPEAEILSDARALLRDQTLLILLLLFVGLLVGIWFSRGLSGALARLAASADAVRRFEFDTVPAVRSAIREVDDLSTSQAAMRRTLARFLDITARVSAEEDLDRLLTDLLSHVVEIAGARAGVLYLADVGQSCLVPAAARAGSGEVPADRLAHAPLDEGPLGLDAAFSTGSAQAGRRDAAELAPFAPLGALPSPAFSLAVALSNRQGEPVGALLLFGDRAFELAHTRFVERLSGFASVSLETREFIRAQKALFDAFVLLIAGAIDAKSPYTGGHCARVPELAFMLAEAACDARDGPLADFDLDEKGWEAVRLAAWLHDCGKVTTPEYVVDKATRLETLNDRIHEVRTRFEALKREREAACWRAIADGADRESALAGLATQWREIDDDFAFVAECNSGETVIDEARSARLRQIAARTWTRTLDDRLGLGPDEAARKAASPAPGLPATEPLLADRPEHRIARSSPPEYPAELGITLQAPTLLYDRGEIKNLTIPRGTLTAEERYKINEHIIHTLAMLHQLPFPGHLAQVPELAGGHHERIDGRGYPRGLTGDQMSPVARMLAIADIYEALTAADRPYKPAKSIEQSLAIMQRMADEGHIDQQLFALFREADIPRRYAERFGPSMQAAAQA